MAARLYALAAISEASEMAPRLGERKRDTAKGRSLPRARFVHCLNI